MSNNSNIVPPAAGELAYYLTMVDLATCLPINTDLASAREQTMISLLGSPLMPLTTTDQPDRASPLVVKLKQTRRLSEHIVATGIRPALDSLATALVNAFDQEKKNGHDLESVLGTAGMMDVRLRKPTSGLPSTQISNHAWGTAIDFNIVGNSAPGNTGHSIPKFVAVLLPFLNAAGWYSGISFHDTMHFEVADSVMQQWSKSGLLTP